MTTFQVTEADCPAGVVDRMLWRDAQHILRRHCDHTTENMCVWCGREWPCGPRRLAERAQAAAYRPAGATWGVYDEVTRGVRAALNERPPYPGAYAVRPVAAGFNYDGLTGRHRTNRRSY